MKKQSKLAFLSIAAAGALLLCASSGCYLPSSLQEWREYRNVEALIARGADLDAPHADIDGDLRLHSAAFNGHSAVVRLLIENQVNVDTRDEVGYTALHCAAMSGKSRVAELLLDAGAYADAHIDTYHIGLSKRRRVSITPLHLAAWHGKLETARLLLVRGATVDAAARGKFTPLHFAAGGGYLKMVELLIAHGADPLFQSVTNSTAMHFAASGGTLVVEYRYAMCDALVLPDDPFEELPDVGMLTTHCGNEHGEIINLMLAKGAKIDRAGTFGFTPLHFAAYGLCPSAIDVLIKAGAKLTTGVSERGHLPLGWPKGTTALHLAADPLEGLDADRGRRVVDALIRAGAPVDAADEYGVTPLHTASHDERPEAIVLLLAAGADVNALSTSFLSEETVQSIATTLNVSPSFYLPDQPHLCIMTPLMAAMLSSASDFRKEPEKARWKEPVLKEPKWRKTTKCSRRLRDSVAILLKNGADVKAALATGETILHMAAARSDGGPLVKMLIDAGADANAKTKEGVTPLHYAALNREMESLKILLENGASPNAKAVGTILPEGILTAENWVEKITPSGTALDWAKEHDRTEAVKLLTPVTNVDR